MAANEAHATVFLEKVQATFTNIRQKACQQKDFIINIINSQMNWPKQLLTLPMRNLYKQTM